MGRSSKEEHSERFGALLYRLREENGLSQNAAAKRLTISQPRLRDYEIGRDPHSGKPTFPPPATVRAIAKLYRYPEDKLLLLAGYLPRAVSDDEAERLSAFMGLTEKEQAFLLASRPSSLH